MGVLRGVPIDVLIIGLCKSVSILNIFTISISSCKNVWKLFIMYCSNYVKHLLRTTVLIKRVYLTEWSSIICKNILDSCVLIKQFLRSYESWIKWHEIILFFGIFPSFLGDFLLNWPINFEIQGSLFAFSEYSQGAI